MNVNDIAFLDTMDEVLGMTVQFVEEARQSNDDVVLGAYLKMASRCLRCALEMYGEHLIQQGEQSAKIQSDADPNGGRLHGDSPASWVA